MASKELIRVIYPTLVRQYCGFTIWFDLENLNITVIDGFKAKTKAEIMRVLEVIHTTSCYSMLVKRGYTRTIESEYQEWRAHNILYKLGILKSRTGTVDLSNNESKIRRFGYSVLSIF
jgi:hypothetical protein